MSNSLYDVSVFWNPFLSIKWALITRTLLRPLNDTVQMKVVFALPLYRDTVISRHLASRTGRLKGKLTDGAQLFLSGDVPHPSSNRIPAEHFDFHNLNYYP